MTAGWAVLGQNPARLGMAHTQATVDAMPLHDLCLISLGCSPFSPANRSPVEGAVDDHMRELAGTMRAAVRGEPAVANAIADGVPSPIRTAVRSAVDLTAYTWGMCGEGYDTWECEHLEPVLALPRGEGAAGGYRNASEAFIRQGIRMRRAPCLQPVRLAPSIRATESRTRRTVRPPVRDLNARPDAACRGDPTALTRRVVDEAVEPRARTYIYYYAHKNHNQIIGVLAQRDPVSIRLRVSNRVEAIPPPPESGGALGGPGIRQNMRGGGRTPPGVGPDTPVCAQRVLKTRPRRALFC